MSINKILTALIVIAILVAGYFYFKSAKKAEAPTTQQPKQETQQEQVTEPPPPPPATSENPVATFDVKDYGTFQVTLDAKAAPKTVENFAKLAKQGFYNGLTFHRITKLPGFHLIQGGDPEGTGMGGPGYTVPAEIGLKHTKGAIAMARLGNEVNPTKASSGSQFYITEEDIAQLDGGYTVFGYVTSGMEIVAKIGATATGPEDNPLEKVIISKITIQE